MTGDTLNQVKEAEGLRQARLKERILCCSVGGCRSAGAEKVKASIQHAIDAAGKSIEVEVCGTGCMGLCSRGPLVRSSLKDVIYTDVKPEDATALAMRSEERRVG